MTPHATRPPMQHAQFGVINSYLVPEADGFTLIDAGVPGLERHVLAVMKRTSRTLRRVVTTHTHPDHIGSMDALKKAFPDLEILVGANDADGMAHHGVLAAPTRLLRGGDSVGSLRVMDTPGHSPGHLAFFDERDGTLYAGDTFVGIPSLRVASVVNAMFPLPSIGTEDLARTVRSARELLDIPAKFLALGHGRVIRDPMPAMRRAVELAEKNTPPHPLILRLAATISRRSGIPAELANVGRWPTK
ncbi:MBL fold metallo-hydrolase [Deinococcus sp. AJ005]|uniref:MBL fold metallo-hydrolase n=1 Tax=Deinococcus sp. AJ005 TaxID=2652443 RepID=UPI00186573B5|nr:MBL fold metallo-hydrolase [Deinococcus sp. AJ005]